MKVNVTYKINFSLSSKTQITQKNTQIYSLKRQYVTVKRM